MSSRSTNTPERIRKRIEEHTFEINGQNIKVTISGGISEYPAIAANAVELVSYADRAMYVGAKFKGRNKIKIYDEKLA
jgi:GGDEF domain-containing protein